MIFVITGSQKFQFNRLLREIDRLVEKGAIEEDVFAQIGYSDYKPVNYAYKDFLDRDEFISKTDESRIVITHGGTGAIIGAVKKGKKVIAVARLAKYGEHVDDHQIQLLHAFEEMNLICYCSELEQLETCIKEIEKREFRPYQSNTNAIIDDIEEFLLSTYKRG